MRAAGRALVVVLVVATALGGGAMAWAQTPDTSAGGAAGAGGPTLTLNPRSATAGQRIDVVFTGWSGRLATLSVCGNLARRGSADCNMVASQGVRLSHLDDTPISSFVAMPPPAACPCVVRAVGTDTAEVAVAPIELVGHPTGPVIAPDAGGAMVEVELTTARADDGLLGSLRSALGGPTAHEVRVRVRNTAMVPLGGLRLDGSVGRDADDVVETFDLVTDPLGPGQAWEGTAVVTLGAPVVGDHVWTVTASGAGPVVRAESTTRDVPVLLVALVVLLAVDLVVIAGRTIRRRRVRARALAADAVGGADLDGLPAEPGAAGPGVDRAEAVVDLRDGSGGAAGRAGEVVGAVGASAADRR